MWGERKGEREKQTEAHTNKHTGNDKDVNTNTLNQVVSLTPYICPLVWFPALRHLVVKLS